MRKNLSITALLLALCLTLTACGGKTAVAAPEAEESSPAVASATVEESAPAEASVSAEAVDIASSVAEVVASEATEIAEEAAAQIPLAEGDMNGAAYVKVKGARKDVDDDGNTVIVLSLDYTNELSEDRMPLSLAIQAVQDGNDLEQSFFFGKDLEIYDAHKEEIEALADGSDEDAYDDYMAELGLNFAKLVTPVSPGETCSFECAFITESDSTVSFNIYSLDAVLMAAGGQLSESESQDVFTFDVDPTQLD